MRKIGFATLLVLVLALIVSGCGSSQIMGAIPNNINGNWTATLINTNGSVAYQFSATFTQQSGSTLSITNLTYTIDSPCPALAVADEAAGSFTATGSSSGRVAGNFAMSEILTNVGGPELTLQGTLSNGTISGTWSVNGLVPICSGNGTFTMQPAMPG
jgi:hypothetical protein